MRALIAATAVLVSILTDLAGAQSQVADNSNSLLEGNAAYGDWKSDAPGVRRYIRASDVPAPDASRSTENAAVLVGRPAEAQLSVPLGFHVKLFASGLDAPRLIRVAPNGDIFIAESLAGRIRVLRPSGGSDEL